MAISRPLFVANWKMNLCQNEAHEFFQRFQGAYSPNTEGTIDCLIAPAFTSLAVVAEHTKRLNGVALSSQNIHWLDSGAHTGEISGLMLRELGVTFAIVGHSERRAHYGETNESVSLRANAAIRHGIIPIICVGESREDFEAERSEGVVLEQLQNSLRGISRESAERIVVAYEPVWAIGTGLAATPEIAGRMHSALRRKLGQFFEGTGSQIPLLYGGSTSPENIGDLLSTQNIDGALVGGASLKPDSFCALIENGRSAFAKRMIHTP